MYQKGNVLPRMFVKLSQAGEKLQISLKQNSFTPGHLYAYSCGHFLLFKIAQNGLVFCLESGFEFGQPFLFCFMARGEMFVGAAGEIANIPEIIEKFRLKEQRLAQDAKAAAEEKDLDRLTDQICHKMFGFSSLAFFEQTRQQLNGIMQKGSRCEELEAAFAEAKFFSLAEGLVVGVVYKAKRPEMIAVGSSVVDSGKQGRYQYIRSRSGAGYFMTFRRASDGDICLF